MTRTVPAFPDDTPLAAPLGRAPGARLATLDGHRCRDGESLVAMPPHLEGEDVALVASLHEPDRLAMPLWFAAHTAREFGARSFGLVARYLAYMRQGRRFKPRQAVSAPLFARFVESAVDWLLTVDPHLHRIERLQSLYRVPVGHVAAAPQAAAWIAEDVRDGVLIGPDAERAQWSASIAQHAGPLPRGRRALHRARELATGGIRAAGVRAAGAPR